MHALQWFCRPLQETFPEANFNFNLDIRPSLEAQVSALFGPPHSGKTSTLDLLAGVHTPAHGQIMIHHRLFFDSHSGFDLPPPERNCGYVLPRQSPLNLSLRQNLLLAGSWVGPGSLQGHGRTHELLELFGLAGVASSKIPGLSPLDVAKANLARPLLGHPSFLLVDEPSLEPIEPGEFLNVLKRYVTLCGHLLLCATTTIEDCFEPGAFNDFGRLLQSGPPDHFAPLPSRARVAELVCGLNLLPAQVLKLDPSAKTSCLRVGRFGIPGPHLFSRFLHDRVTLWSRYDEVRACPITRDTEGNFVQPAQRGIAREHRTVRLPF